MSDEKTFLDDYMKHEVNLAGGFYVKLDASQRNSWHEFVTSSVEWKNNEASLQEVNLSSLALHHPYTSEDRSRAERRFITAQRVLSECKAALYQLGKAWAADLE